MSSEEEFDADYAEEEETIDLERGSDVLDLLEDVLCDEDGKNVATHLGEINDTLKMMTKVLVKIAASKNLEK